MKLTSFSFKNTPRVPGLRAGDLVTIDCDKPGSLKDWRLSLRGQQAFLVSPPGWSAGGNWRPDPKGRVTVFEVPRADMTFGWTGMADEVEAIFKANKYDSEPFGFVPEPVASGKSLLAQIPSSQVGDA